jgi:hypothetical protein
MDIVPKLTIFRNKYPKYHFFLNLLFSFAIFCLYIPDCKAQISFSLSQPQLSVSDSNLVIKYDILSASSGDKFYVWMEVTDSLGKRMGAYSLNGDIGDSIQAGTNKQIIWNLQADNIFIDNTINIEIFAEKLVRPETPPKEIEITEKPVASREKVKTGKHLIQSAVFPGWGMTSLTKGKPYWLLGVAGMGCIATSYYYNQQAHSSYDEYLESSDDDIKGYYDDAVAQGNISKVFAWSAAAIWIADLGIVTIKAISMNKAYKRSRAGAFSVSPSVDLTTDTPVLTLRYNF